MAVESDLVSEESAMTAWRIVPLPPTREMIAAGDGNADEWRNMLAAAPASARIR